MVEQPEPLYALERTVGSLEGKFEAFERKFERSIDRIERLVERIESVEKKQASFVGAAGLLTAILTVVGAERLISWWHS